MKIQKQDLRDFIQSKDDVVKYDLFITLPLRPKYQTLDKNELSSLLKSFIVNINRKVFSKRELKDYNSPKTFECIPVRENDETSIHIIAKCPVSKKLPDNSLKYMKFKNILNKEIVRMKLFQPNGYKIVKKKYSKDYDETENQNTDLRFIFLHRFYKKIYSNAVDMINYTSKRERKDDVDFDIIDVDNMRVMSSS
tara:strand:- start:117 stop:701 length:585 start_codon:yes stop_codon:yes gene_type:complete